MLQPLLHLIPGCQSDLTLPLQVVFIDEIDALAPARSSGGSVSGRLVSTLLTEMDRLQGGSSKQQAAANCALPPPPTTPTASRSSSAAPFLP
jgi:hypothetical protein